MLAPAPAVSTVQARPFLKWAGGKGRLLPQYEPYFPHQIATYYEPFLGGGAVFFHLAPRLRSAVLADINPELVNVYRCVRDHVQQVIDCLITHRDCHGQHYYYSLRSQTGLSCPVQRAARLIYLNKTCYNGLYRENSKGHFNVPMGRYKKPAICDPELLLAASNALQIAHLREASFEETLGMANRPGDFVYLDPPYHPISSTSCFTGYSRHGFVEADQRRLQQAFADLASRGVPAMLSNSDCSLIRQLYQGHAQHSITATRAINSKARQRGRVSELLITSY